MHYENIKTWIGGQLKHMQYDNLCITTICIMRISTVASYACFSGEGGWIWLYLGGSDRDLREARMYSEQVRLHTYGLSLPHPESLLLRNTYLHLLIKSVMCPVCYSFWFLAWKTG